MIDFQKVMDMVGDAMRETRKQYHVTLGEMISLLGQADPDAKIGLTDPHSYRGYYADLALEPTLELISVKQLIAQLNLVLDKTLEGYKGGDFLMSADTPVWVAHYGCTGRALLDVDPQNLNLSLKDPR